MANKTFEDLAKELGYKTFADMKNTIGKANSFSISSFFKKEKSPTSPTKEGEDGSISSDIIPFLNIIAKNSLALPGMARDMNVLRQNIVKLVKLKNAEAITKADKFFKTEDQKEAELEAARKKETSPKPEKESKPKKEKMEKGGEDTIFDVLWDFIKKTVGALIIGLGIAFAKVFDIGKLISDIADKLNPLPLIENLFKSIEEGWKEITETDIIKETLIKGFGKFLDFVTGGLFGEKELRKSLDDLKEYVTPMIDVISESFQKIVGWLKDNIGWDPFTIPLSKANEYLPDWAKKFSLPDIQIPGFRPFQKNAEMPAPTTDGKSSPPAPPPTEDLKTAKTAQGDIQYDEGGNVISGSLPSEPTPTKQPAKRTQEGKTKRVPENVAKEAEKDKKSAVEFLKTQVGIVYDPNSPTQFSDFKTGNFVEEQAVRDRIVDMKGNPDKILALIKGTTPTTAPKKSAPAAAATGNTPTGTATGGAASATTMGGGSSPTAETSPAPATSGASLSQSSSEVAEGQRMDAAADAGVYVDAGTTNNEVSSSGKKPKQTASAYNTGFIDSYYAVPT